MNDYLQNMTPNQVIGILLIVAMVAHLALGFILRQVSKHTSKTKNQLDDHLLKSVSTPLKTLIWFGWFYLVWMVLLFYCGFRRANRGTDFGHWVY